MNTIFLVLALSTLFSSILHATKTTVLKQTDLIWTDRKDRRCGAQCRFRLCNVSVGMPLAPIGRRINLRPGSFKSPPIICSADNTVGKIMRTGNPEILDKSTGMFIPMNKFRPDGMSPNLPKRFILARTIISIGRSVVVRKATKGNQHDFLHKQCIRLPITSYKEIDSDGNDVGTVTTAGNKETDCVSLSSGAPTLMFELFWQGSSDLDLEVTEPDGNTLSFSNTSNDATGGVHVTDSNVNECGNVKVGREVVSYGPNATPLLGTYRFRFRVYRKCERRNKWRFTFMLRGQEITMREGRARPSGRETQSEYMQLGTFVLTADMLA